LVKTDNLFLDSKLKLRYDWIKKSSGDLTVLDCYHGDGILWNEISSRSDRKITVIGIDIKSDKKALIGDNIKFLKTLNLSEFDVIDLDAYGNPFHQIEVIKKRNYSGIIFFTWCKVGQGEYPQILNPEPGYRFADTPTAKKLMKGFFHKIGINSIEYMLIRKTGGFNVYGRFKMQ
jgi:hypothetical protein